MVRAILDGRKTQTRRIVKLPLKDPATGCEIAGCEVNSVLRDTPELCPYGQPGDQLWVRETFGFVGGIFIDDEMHDWTPDRPAKEIRELKFGRGYHTGHAIYAADAHF